MSTLDICQNFQTPDWLRICLSVHQFDSTLEELSSSLSRRRETVAYSDGLPRMILSSGLVSGCVNCADLEIAFQNVMLYLYLYLLSNHMWRSIDEHNLTIFCPYSASFLIDAPAPHLVGRLWPKASSELRTSSLFVLSMKTSSHTQHYSLYTRKF